MTLYCPASDSLFLRANGRFVCWDDAGSDEVLLHDPEEVSAATLLEEGGPCSMVSKRLNKGLLPRPDVCPGCYCLSPVSRNHFDPGTINVIQVEPSSRCTLRCPACASEEERNSLEPPRDLSPERFYKILKDIDSAELRVRSFDFSGHGEPLQNSELAELIALARKFHPESFISICTNGQGECSRKIVSSGVDLIQVAIDGVDQASYSAYRMGGDFLRAREFASSVVRFRSGTEPQVEWRYILFSHNDTREHLSELWKQVRESGVDRLRFIFTDRGMRSENIREPDDLRTMMAEIGVPRWNSRIRDHSTVCRVRSEVIRLRLSPGICRIARSIRRRVRYMGNRGSLPLVLTDYCRSELETLKRFTDYGLAHAAAGRPGDALDFLNHVEALVQLPARHNPDYEPESVFRLLEEPFMKLRSLRTSEHGS